MSQLMYLYDNVNKRRKKMKDLILKLEDEDYRRLEWLSNKLELSVNQCLRALIPKIELPESKTVSQESEIATANPRDLVPVRELNENDEKDINLILTELKENKYKWASTLAKEISRQIIDKKTPKKFISVGTYKRLSRWVTPYRWSEREKFVKPRAEKISEILFGRGINRID
jgi:hypothetical protein